MFGDQLNNKKLILPCDMLIRDLLRRNVIAPLSVLSLLLVFFFSPQNYENEDIILCYEVTLSILL